MKKWFRMQEKFKIGISSCLLENKVQWNSGHKLDRYLTNTLGKFVEYVPVYPEVEVGFGVPRESLINHYVLKYKQPYLKQQRYSNPHPPELKLGMHV